MDVLIEIIKSIDKPGYIGFGGSVSLIGFIFWYMPYSHRFKSQEKKHSILAREWRDKGYIENADRLEKMHAIKNLRLPVYGKTMVVVGLVIVGVASVGL